MPKLSIKLDKKTFEQLKNKADEEHTTISKYAEKKLSESLDKEWPEHYSDLFGAIDDKTFDVENHQVIYQDKRKVNYDRTIR